MNNNNKPNQIFYDHHKKRWPRIKNSFLILISLVFVLFTLFILTVYLSPELSNMSLLPVSHLGAIKYHVNDKGMKPYFPNYKLHEHKKKGKYTPAVMIGFLVNYDDASLRSLMNNLDDIDVVIGEFLHLDSANGDFIEDNVNRQTYVADFIVAHKPQTKIIPLINNMKDGKWQSQMVATMLSSPATQKKVIQSLLNYVTSHHYAGINIDFETIPVKSRDQLTDFMRQLSTVFHQQGLSVSIDVMGDDHVYDFSKLSSMVDYLVLMLYDEHWSEGKSGPVSSLSWFAKSLNARLTDIPISKLVIGLGSYGYDWASNAKQAEDKSFQDIMLTADLSSSNITFDPVALNPVFRYSENHSISHTVWFLDAPAIFNQLAISQSLHPYGYALWRLGSEDPSFWNIAGHSVGADDVKKLEKINAGYSVSYEGKGEILDVVKQPEQGFRKLSYDPRKQIITKESYDTYPTSYVINRYGGGNPKKIALTFDDGPDPVYTPQILDILKQTNTHATFFVVGANALLYPDLLKREFAEGHDIGNHTFTHPNVSEISFRQLEIQVTSTNRVLESYLGRGSHLFRPPYAEDTEPENVENVKGIYGLSQLGYLIVGMNIDPLDWQQPGTDKIVQFILSGVSSHEGNIVLLHDSGGSREQTVAALPTIISDLKALGYQLVSVSELMDISQEAIMPPVTKENAWKLFVDDITFSAMYLGSKSIKILFLICIFVGLARVLFLSYFAIYQKFRDRFNGHEAKSSYSVAAIIPAYNEEKVITRTIDSLLVATHPPEFEIIVVDDGSTDNTLNLLKRKYESNPLITIISQENAGKPAALNNAIKHTNATLIVTLDADTLFLNNTIMELICRFDDPGVGAIAGNIKVGNRINVLTKMQAIEYITSQNMERRAFKVLDAITVVPGAVGAWRRDLVVDAGGFSDETLAEDADLTLNIRRLGYHIEYADRAIAFTEAPDTINMFLKQRYRWMFGTFQVAWKNLDALFRPRYRSLGFVALPSIFMNQIILPIMSPLMDLLLVLSLISFLINRVYHPSEYSTDSLLFILTWYALFTLVDFLTGFLSFLLEKQENKKLLLWLIPQRFFYRQLIYYIALKTLIASLRGHTVMWDKLVRKASVTV